MSTRSYIAYQDDNGIIHYRFHHWDGYIAGVGATLISAFQKEESVKRLFDIKANFSTINYSLPDDDYQKKMMNDNYQRIIIGNQVVYAFKDENIKEIEAQTVKTIPELIRECDQEYLYLYTNNRWLLVVDKKNLLSLESILAIDEMGHYLETIDENKDILNIASDYIIDKNLLDTDKKIITYCEQHNDFDFSKMFEMARCKKDSMVIAGVIDNSIKKKSLKNKKDKI